MTQAAETPITYLITKGEATDSNYLETGRQILDIIRVAVDKRVSMVQIREKRLSARLLFELGEAAVSITRGSVTKLLINDRADIALGVGADGVHLTANSLPTTVIRASFPPEFVIGVSAHSLEAIKTAAAGGANFAVFAAVFASPGKAEPLGLESLKSVCSASRPFPILALGGIDETNFRNVIAAGASGFAAIRSMNEVDCLRSIMKAVRSI